MQTLPWLLGLPASLLLPLSAQIAAVHADTHRLPIAIRKMGTTDAGEKILHEYLAFGDEQDIVQPSADARAGLSVAAGALTPAEAELLAANSSAAIMFRAPLAAHFSRGGNAGSADERESFDMSESFNRARMAEARLARRDFACPVGSSSCSAIGFPNSCCQSGETCVQITDTGLGPVGCCPSGVQCTGTIACSGDQQGCSSESGGGCCIPGWSCASVGCTQSATAITATATAASTRTSSQITTTTTSRSFTSTPTSSPTTASPSITTNTGGTTPTAAPGYCPTGFYACEAVYGGGCCQTGRDCHTTSCPSTAYTTIISGGVTIAVPVTDVPASPTTAATCAGGWSLCPPEAGPVAGCCPGGYSCGTASCFLTTGTATAAVAKELPGSGAMRRGNLRSAVGMIPALMGFAFGFVLI